jgi:glutaminyl-peptide cyclotransferase
MSFRYRRIIFLVIAGMMACKTSNTSELGKLAYDWTGEIVAFGPRPTDSAAIQKVRDWIEKKVQSFGLTVQKRPFVARTPKGFKNMVNLSYIVPGTKHDEHVVLMAHYDSKLFSDKRFVGANDAASSVALLLTLTKPLQKMQLPFDVQIVFVDGEEALVQWDFNDSLYGSRQMAQDIHNVKVKDLIVVDMIGDKDLSFIRSRGVDEKLLSYFEQSLKEMSQSDKLEAQWSYVTDDHTPFMEAGIPTLHVMDFTFGGPKSPGTLWHTEQDNMENISAESLSITGEAILRILKKIS